MKPKRSALKKALVACLLVMCIGGGLPVAALQQESPAGPAAAQDALPQEGEGEGTSGSPVDTPPEGGGSGGDSSEVTGEPDPASEDDSEADALDKSEGLPAEDTAEPEAEPEAAPQEPDVEAPDEDEMGMLEEERGAFEVMNAQDGLMEVLNASTVIVYKLADFKTALTVDNGYTYIYLGANIECTTSGGIIIHAKKTNVVIDGCPPGAPAGTRFTYTDYNSSAAADPIRVTSNAIKSVTLKNLKLTGRNFYGIVCTTDTSTLAPTITYDNVSYSGPQMGFLRYSTVMLRNTDIQIVKNGSSVVNEVFEVRHVVLEGKVTITSPATANAIFWMVHGANTFTVKSGANVKVTSASFFIYNDVAPFTDFVMEPNSNLAVDVNNTSCAFTYASHRLRSLTMGTGASLTIRQGANSAYGALRVGVSLSMDPGSSLDITCTGASGGGLYFPVAGATVKLSDPERVRIYAPSKKIMDFTGASTLSITTGAVNFWTTAGAGETAAPTKRWNKAGTAAMTVNAKSSGNTLPTASFTTNVTASDPVDDLPAYNGFPLFASQLMVMGRYTLTVNEVTGRSTQVTGTAAAGAVVSAAYTAEAGGQTAGPLAAAGGAYALPLAKAPRGESLVKVTTREGQLHARQDTKVVDAGVLEMSAPATMAFGTAAITGTGGRLDRPGGSWTVNVGDSRLHKTAWALQVSVPAPLSATVGENTSTLPGALVYWDGVTETTLDAAPFTVHTQGAAGGSLNMTWAQNTGILIKRPAGGVYSGVEYSATLNWTLVAGP